MPPQILIPLRLTKSRFENSGAHLECGNVLTLIALVAIKNTVWQDSYSVSVCERSKVYTVPENNIVENIFLKINVRLTSPVHRKRKSLGLFQLMGIR